MRLTAVPTTVTSMLTQSARVTWPPERSSRSAEMSISRGMTTMPPASVDGLARGEAGHQDRPQRKQHREHDQREHVPLARASDTGDGFSSQAGRVSARRSVGGRVERAHALEYTPCSPSVCATLFAARISTSPTTRLEQAGGGAEAALLRDDGLVVDERVEHLGRLPADRVALQDELLEADGQARRPGAGSAAAR